MITGVSMAAFRLCGATALFWCISPLVPKQRIEKGDWRHLVIMSLCGMGINQFCYVIGVQHTSPTNACVIATSTPVFTFVLSALFLHASVTLRKVGGLVLAATGALILILGSQLQGGKSGNVLGDAICLFSQLSAPCYFVFFQRHYQKVSSRHSDAVAVSHLGGHDAAHLDSLRLQLTVDVIRYTGNRRHALHGNLRLLHQLLAHDCGAMPLGARHRGSVQLHTTRYCRHRRNCLGHR